MLLTPASVRAWALGCLESVGLQDTLSSSEAWSTAVGGCSGTSGLPEPGKEEQWVPALTGARGVTLLGVPTWASCAVWEGQALPCSCRGRVWNWGWAAQGLGDMVPVNQALVLKVRWVQEPQGWHQIQNFPVYSQTSRTSGYPVLPSGFQFQLSVLHGSHSDIPGMENCLKQTNNYTFFTPKHGSHCKC